MKVKNIDLRVLRLLIYEMIGQVVLGVFELIPKCAKEYNIGKHVSALNFITASTTKPVLLSVSDLVAPAA